MLRLRIPGQPPTTDKQLGGAFVKRVSILLLIIVSLLASSFAGIGAPRASADTIGVSATVSPTTANTVCTLTFVIAARAASQSHLFLLLPSFQVPASIPASAITVNNIPAQSVAVSSGFITITTLVPFSGSTTVVVSASAGIKTPASAGTYTVTCVTDANDQGSGSVSITGSAASSFTASFYPMTAGSAIQYGYVSFTPAVTIPAGGVISLAFPAGTTLPAYTPGSILVANTAVASASVSGTQLNLTVGAAVAAQASTTIVFMATYGLRNTTIPGTYQLRLWTSVDPTVLYSSQFQIGGGSVANVTVQVSSTAPQAAATYNVYFAATSGLNPGNTISVQFPSGTTFSSSLSAGVKVNGITSPYAVLSGTTVTITVPSSVTVTAGSWVTVSFADPVTGAGIITNPASTGTYYLWVSTSIDTTAVQSSNSYSITGTSITGVTMIADPKAQSAAVQFTITFNTSASGTLAANSGTVILDFPSSMTLPSSISSSLVTVNGLPAHYVSVGTGNVITITTPVSIAAYQQVTVVLSKNIGMVNPASSGVTVTLAVSTSADVAPVATSYTTITSQVTQPQVQLTSYGAGSVAGYTISFSTGAIGILRAGIDRISIVFPSGTIVPTGITRNQVTVNGYPAYAVTAYTNRMDITPAMNVTANGSVQIVISKDAGIKNPPVAVAYTLQAYTSVEIAPITSATYTIVNLPKTLVLISPVAPDGLNGYYKTRPTVVLSASSAIDPSPVVYYAINGGAQQIYSAPIQLPDGTDTLTYYARDRQGNQEDPQTATFKVDATAPTATITSPADGTVVGKSPVTVIGKVAPGMQVSVAGRAVTVATTGDFTVDVPLVEGAQTIVFTVTSISGNIGQAQLKVTLDTTPPSLAITKPTMYSTTNSNICEVAGKTEVGATVQVAGVTVAVKADGTFSQNVMLKEGSNIITIVATDAVGNTRTIGIPVTYKARTVITLQIGNKTAMVNDTKKTLQSVPVIVNGHTLVPLRFIGEAFGATVDWDPVYKIVTIELKGKSIRLQVGAKYASVAGKTVTLETPPVILKGYTMVPIRFISEAFGAQVVWNAPTKGIVITYPKP